MLLALLLDISYIYSGMPECKFGMNDKLVMEKEAKAKASYVPIIPSFLSCIMCIIDVHVHDACIIALVLIVVQQHQVLQLMMLHSIDV